MKDLGELNLPSHYPPLLPSRQQAGQANRLKEGLSLGQLVSWVPGTAPHRNYVYPTCPAHILKCSWNDPVRGKLMKYQEAWVVWL